MSKIKINFKKENYKVLKYNKHKITVKKFISIEELISVSQIALELFFKNNQGKDNSILRLDDYIAIQAHCDLLLLNTCTNIDVAGIEHNDLAESGIITKVREIVANSSVLYKTVENEILNRNMKAIFEYTVGAFDFDEEKLARATGKLFDKIDTLDKNLVQHMYKNEVLK